MKVHKEGTGLLLMLFTICFIVDLTLYHTIGAGWVFYLTAGVTSVFFLLVLNFFRSPSRRFPYDSEGLVIAPADGTIVAIEEVRENEILHKVVHYLSVHHNLLNLLGVEHFMQLVAAALCQNDDTGNLNAAARTTPPPLPSHFHPCRRQ